MSEIVWSDRALARTLGTDDPNALATVKTYLESPTAEVALTYSERTDAYDATEPDLELVDVNEEIDKILARHGHLRRP